ncbi:MAG: COG4223 family protein [Microvirga sp.]
MTAKPSDPSGPSGRKRKREPVTLDLTASEVPAERESSLTDDPRMPEHPPEAAAGPSGGTEDDPRAPRAAAEPTPGEIEAALERLIPEAERAAAAEVPPAEVSPTQDIGEAPPPELGPGSEPVAAMPAGAAADRIDDKAPHSDEPVAAPREPRRRSGAGGLVAAALLGGFTGAGLTAAAERYWPERGDTTGPRIAQLEERMAAVPTADVGAIERRLAAMETQQRETAQRAQAAQTAAERATQRAEAAANRPADPAATPQPAAGLDSVALEKIESRIAALEDRARTQTEGGSKIAEQLEARLSEQAKQVATLAPQLAEQGQRLGTIAGQSAEQTQRLAALSQQVAQQNQRVEALAKQFAERGPEAAAALRVVAADRVANALRDGTPFPEAFGALVRLKAEPQRLAAIEPFAKAGAPSAGALSQEFKPISQKIIAEARGPATGWSDRIGRMAEGIVTIRPDGEPGSNTVPSLVARIDDALARGALAEAAAAWDALPEPARRAQEDFGRRLKARAAAEDAARAISNQALAALDAATR